MPKIPQNIYLAIALVILVVGLFNISNGRAGIGVFYLVVGGFGLISWNLRRKSK